MNDSTNRHNVRAPDANHDQARIQGGNWKMQGFRRSTRAYDEAECQMSISEFMEDTQGQGRYPIVE